MSDSLGEIDLNIKPRLVNEFIPRDKYYRHSDIDLFISITITQILNFKSLLTEEFNKFIQDNYGCNYDYYSDIKEEKENLLKQYLSQNQQKNSKDSLLSYDFPEFEIYFIAKLFVDRMERKPECWTKYEIQISRLNY